MASPSSSSSLLSPSSSDSITASHIGWTEKGASTDIAADLAGPSPVLVEGLLGQAMCVS